ncbi:hypothetical protein [Tropicimonas sp. IMCC6043]|uniref:hypothetical protein n=1 Tax=Tropicimonas sp. IMCC6043 TaxID=2510645 RepID=UPI00101E2077|nr:hypothetical protein [Tropicimonas sp. IMCC6043]RYH08686.1 hypothetical protein EU800_15670 [Tropicimonas sp. IMCC6043]
MLKLFLTALFLVPGLAGGASAAAVDLPAGWLIHIDDAQRVRHDDLLGAWPGYPEDAKVAVGSVSERHASANVRRRGRDFPNTIPDVVDFQFLFDGAGFPGLHGRGYPAAILRMFGEVPPGLRGFGFHLWLIGGGNGWEFGNGRGTEPAQPQLTQVSLPTTASLLAAGLVLLAGIRRRRER